MDEQPIKPNPLLSKCAETRLMKDGTVQIHCKLGLWGVSGRNRKQVEREAMHYWFQYYEDGEYSTLLL